MRRYETTQYVEDISEAQQPQAQQAQTPTNTATYAASAFGDEYDDDADSGSSSTSSGDPVMRPMYMQYVVSVNAADDAARGQLRVSTSKYMVPSGATLESTRGMLVDTK